MERIGRACHPGRRDAKGCGRQGHRGGIGVRGGTVPRGRARRSAGILRGAPSRSVGGGRRRGGGRRKRQRRDEDDDDDGGGDVVDAIPPTRVDIQRDGTSAVLRPALRSAERQSSRPAGHVHVVRDISQKSRRDNLAVGRRGVGSQVGELGRSTRVVVERRREGRGGRGGGGDEKGGGGGEEEARRRPDDVGGDAIRAKKNGDDDDGGVGAGKKEGGGDDDGPDAGDFCHGTIRSLYEVGLEEILSRQQQQQQQQQRLIIST